MKRKIFAIIEVMAVLLTAFPAPVMADTDPVYHTANIQYDPEMNTPVRRAYIETQYSMIPAKMREHYETSFNEHMIYVMNGQGDHTADAKTALDRSQYDQIFAVTRGYVAENTVCIYLEGDSLQGLGALIHEFGHCVDFMGLKLTGSYWSNQSAFQDCYNSERNNFGDAYAAYNSLEFFAEAFYYYCTFPDKLLQMAPKTYQYMKAIDTYYELYM